MDLPWVYLAVAMIASYLCGSIPTSVWWGRTFFGVDVREHGSRNAGATNTFRVLGPKAGIPVLLIDIAKGFVPVRVLPKWSGLEPGSDAWIALRVVLALAAVTRSSLSGVRTVQRRKGRGHLVGRRAGGPPGGGGHLHRGLRAGLPLSPLCLAGLAMRGRGFPTGRGARLPRNQPVMLMVFAVLLCAVVFYTHRHNIGRLMRGEENRMSLAGKGGDGG